MKTLKWFACLVMTPAVLLLWPAAPAAAVPGELVPVRMMLQWTHQAQFAGYYVAREKGFYRERGLDVSIVQGGPGIEPMDHLAQGDVDFVSAWLSTALMRREKGLPAVHVVQIVNSSNLVMVSWRMRDEETPDDLTGHRISLWEGDLRAPYEAWLQSEKVNPSAIHPQYYSVNLFLRKGVAACSAMYYNEVHMLFQAGVDADDRNVFFLKDYGFGFPEDGIYCTVSTLGQRPETVEAFREASLKGWRYAAEHPDEALEIVMGYVTAANVATNRPHMKWMLEKILASVVPTAADGWVFGKLAREDYEKTVRIMRERGMLVEPPAFEVFTGEVMARVP